MHWQWLSYESTVHLRDWSEIGGNAASYRRRKSALANNVATNVGLLYPKVRKNIGGDIPIDVPTNQILVRMCPRHPRRGWCQWCTSTVTVVVTVFFFSASLLLFHDAVVKLQRDGVEVRAIVESFEYAVSRAVETVSEWRLQTIKHDTFCTIFLLYTNTPMYRHYINLDISSYLTGVSRRQLHRRSGLATLPSALWGSHPLVTP